MIFITRLTLAGPDTIIPPSATAKSSTDVILMTGKPAGSEIGSSFSFVCESSGG